MWVLIIIVVGGFAHSTPAVTTQEFTTAERCTAAAHLLTNDSVAVFCVEK
jgi:hypothetical protein